MSLVIPKVEPGDILTTDITSDFVSDAQAVLGSIVAENIKPYAISRYHFDAATDSSLAAYGYKEQHTTSGAYNNTTYDILSHGSITSDFTWSGAGIPIVPGMVIRAHLTANIGAITVHATDAHVAEDEFFFRLELEDDDRNMMHDSAEWGTSIFVRNSGSTLTADANIDTSAFDKSNFYKYRQVDISDVVVVGDAVTPYNLKIARWMFKLPGGWHNIYIKEFTVAFYIYRG